MNRAAPSVRLVLLLFRVIAPELTRLVGKAVIATIANIICDIVKKNGNADYQCQPLAQNRGDNYVSVIRGAILC
jgi:hypothetical protein